MFYLLISLYVFPLSEYYLQKNDKDTIYYLYFLYFKSCQSSISVKKHKVKKCFVFLVLGRDKSRPVISKYVL